jgi:hypothetical protein
MGGNGHGPPYVPQAIGVVGIHQNVEGRFRGHQVFFLLWRCAVETKIAERDRFPWRAPGIPLDVDTEFPPSLQGQIRGEAVGGTDEET